MKLRPPALLALFLGVSALVTFLFWRSVSFGRRLDDGDLDLALAPDATARTALHGIVELTTRWTEGAPGMDRWAERLVAVSRRDEANVRRAAAWAMQWDVEDPGIAARLREIVATDADVCARRNAACSLSLSKDPSAAVPVLRSMLEPFRLTAPAAGTVTSLAAAGRRPKEDDSVGRLRTADGRDAEIAAPVPGRVVEALARAGDAVHAGDPLLVLSPDAGHVLSAAKGLAHAGTPADLDLLRTFLAPGTDAGADVVRQVQAAIAAIESRRAR